MGFVSDGIKAITQPAMNLVGDITGSNASAAAAQGMATAQATASANQLQFEKDTRQQALSIAQPSYDELAQIKSQFQMSQDLMTRQITNLQNQQALLDSTDPALREAGKQALELMQGKDAASLSPIKNERTLQRNQLENQLRDRLGSGYATSSAGQEALNRFDAETANVMTSAQQGTIGQYLGVAQNVRPNMGADLNSAYGGVAQISNSGLSAMNNITGRQISAISGTPVNFQNTIATSGAPYAGAYYRGHAQEGFVNNAMGAGAMAMMM